MTSTTTKTLALIAALAAGLSAQTASSWAGAENEFGYDMPQLRAEGGGLGAVVTNNGNAPFIIYAGLEESGGVVKALASGQQRTLEPVVWRTSWPSEMLDELDGLSIYVATEAGITDLGSLNDGGYADGDGDVVITIKVPALLDQMFGAHDLGSIDRVDGDEAGGRERDPPYEADELFGGFHSLGDIKASMSVAEPEDPQAQVPQDGPNVSLGRSTDLATDDVRRPDGDGRIDHDQDDTDDGANELGSTIVSVAMK